MPTKLSFGTAGIRAPLGDGPDHMNATTVRTVVLALAEYLQSVFADAQARGVCIAFDGRSQSDEFAVAATEVLLASGFQVHRFAQVAPTPLLAFCTRRLDAAAGVMITASHNPAGDNGIKVYFRGGAQVLAPHDREIAARMHALDDADQRPRMTLTEGRARGKLHELGANEQAAYIAMIEAQLAPSTGPWSLSVAYTAMCGVGSATTHALLKRRPVQAFYEVEAQALPLADFGGLSSPNPEHPAALVQLLARMQETSSELAIAHDPDADRLAVVARDATGAARVLSGDEIGSLLASWLLSRDPDPKSALVVSTVVSSELIARIAAQHGARFEQTLTGFKWIAARARKLAREEQLRFLFGYEEAIGFALGAMSDDKDGIAAMAVVLELADALKAQGSSLVGELERLAHVHGLFVSRQITFSAVGADGMQRLKAAMAGLRSAPPTRLLDAPATFRDYAHDADAADLVVLRAEEQRMCVRPSGTEPKLKVYLHARLETQADESFASCNARAKTTLDRLEAEARAAIAW